MTRNDINTIKAAATTPEWNSVVMRNAYGTEYFITMSEKSDDAQIITFCPRGGIYMKSWTWEEVASICDQQHLTHIGTCPRTTIIEKLAKIHINTLIK